MVSIISRWSLVRDILIVTELAFIQVVPVFIVRPMGIFPPTSIILILASLIMLIFFVSALATRLPCTWWALGVSDCKMNIKLSAAR